MIEGKRYASAVGFRWPLGQFYIQVEQANNSWLAVHKEVFGWGRWVNGMGILFPALNSYDFRIIATPWLDIGGNLVRNRSLVLQLLLMLHLGCEDGRKNTAIDIFHFDQVLFSSHCRRLIPSHFAQLTLSSIHHEAQSRLDSN